MNSRKKIILHIGMLKTGTTSLQFFLRRNQKALTAQGVGLYLPKYSSFNPSSNAGFLCWETFFDALGKNSSMPENIKEMSAFSEYAKAFDSLILSEEFLSELGVEIPGYWEMIKKNLTKMTGEDSLIEIVLFVRRQDDWILSRWKQQVLNSFFKDEPSPPIIPDFSDYINLEKTRRLLDYGSALDKLEKVFGRDHITVCGYDKKKDMSFDAVKVFLNATGISLPYSTILKENQSISMRAAEALLLINRSKNTADIPRNKIHRAARVFSVLYPDRHVFYPMNEENRSRFLSQFNAANERLALFYNQGVPFFSSEIEKYTVWSEDPVQCEQDAATILKLSSISSETSAFLMRKAREISQKNNLHKNEFQH